MTDRITLMIEIATKILDAICLLIGLSWRGTGDSFDLVAEVLLLRQKLLVLKRGKIKCPRLSTSDRLIMGLCTLVMTPKRTGQSAIEVAESTLQNFFRALVNRKYSRLFSNKARSITGAKGI